jgi:hypothetical protein
LAVGQVYGVLGGFDVIDLRDPEIDPAVELGAAGPDDLGWIGQAKRDEQKSRLVDVAIVSVDYDDLCSVTVDPVETIGGQRAAGPASENDDSMRHTLRLHDCPLSGHPSGLGLMSRRRAARWRAAA